MISYKSKESIKENKRQKSDGNLSPSSSSFLIYACNGRHWTLYKNKNCNYFTDESCLWVDSDDDKCVKNIWYFFSDFTKKNPDFIWGTTHILDYYEPIYENYPCEINDILKYVQYQKYLPIINHRFFDEFTPKFMDFLDRKSYVYLMSTCTLTRRFYQTPITENFLFKNKVTLLHILDYLSPPTLGIMCMVSTNSRNIIHDHNLLSNYTLGLCNPDYIPCDENELGSLRFLIEFDIFGIIMNTLTFIDVVNLFSTNKRSSLRLTILFKKISYNRSFQTRLLPFNVNSMISGCICDMDSQYPKICGNFYSDKGRKIEYLGNIYYLKKKQKPVHKKINQFALASKGPNHLKYKFCRICDDYHGFCGDCSLNHYYDNHANKKITHYDDYDDEYDDYNCINYDWHDDSSTLY